MYSFLLELIQRVHTESPDFFKKLRIGAFVLLVLIATTAMFVTGGIFTLGAFTPFFLAHYAQAIGFLSTAFGFSFLPVKTPLPVKEVESPKE